MGDLGNLLKETTARTLLAGDLEAVFLPGRGMLGASLRHRGQELLGRVDDLEAAALSGSTAGIPLLYPWANRLAALCYGAAGREVVLEPGSALLHFDEHGLPIHGVPWARLRWEVTEATSDTLKAGLDWTRPDLLAVFPFRHRVEMRVALGPDSLSVETTVLANGGDPVPVSFGFHPYLALPGLSRDQWRLRLPAMRRWTLDARGLPTGEETPFTGFDGLLEERSFDDGFSLAELPAALFIGRPDLSLGLHLLHGYGHAQVFAPKGKPYVALEPMTAPTAALSSGRGLRSVEPGGQFRAAFRIGVHALA